MSKQISVLVIDDDRMIRQILQSILSRKGFDIYTAEDGPTGLKTARQENIDIILLDWMMPGMDGMEVLKLLKNNEKTKNVPVLMLTSKETEQDIDQAASKGSDGYIVKPFNTSQIDKTIRNKLNNIRDTNTNKKKSGFKSLFSKRS